jgi:tripartite-type tricarboxylate transporter receptor subunit TctC
MKLPRRNFLQLAAGAAALPAMTRFTWAQAYPTRPITIVVPFPAGGPTDTLARILAEQMRTLLGQSVIVENVTGASGSIGVGRVAKAAPDGYTLSIGHLITHVFNGAVFTLPYDPVEDFAPVSLLAAVPTWLIGRTSLPAKDLKELIPWLKAHPDKASAATVGAGSAASPLCHPFPEQDGHALPTRALSRRCPDHAGLDRRADRPDVR